MYGARYNHEIAGFNSRLDEVQAGILSEFLPYLDTWNHTRNQLAEIYLSELQGLADLRLLEPRDGFFSSYHIFPVFIGKGQRDALAKYLDSQGIGTNIHYPVPMHRQNCLQSLGFVQGDFPMTEKLCSEELSLPLDPYKTPEDIYYVARKIRQFFKK